ncbi:MAG: YHYH protein [Bacteroidota bacterium]
MAHTFTLLAFTLLLVACSTSHKSSSANDPDLSDLDFLAEYSISAVQYGTSTSVTIKGDRRFIKSNGLPNHKTGVFPNAGNPNQISAQNRTYELPLHPEFSDEPRWVREPGVALNGVKFEPGTAERFVCESGEVYRIEAFQELIDLGLDFNHAHVQPTGAYHYHGVPTELIKLLDRGADLVHVGFALDGFPIYYSKSNAYRPSYELASEARTGDACSYRNPKNSIEKNLEGSEPDGIFVSDWEYREGIGDLDECNGATVNGEYAYFVTKDYPYMSRCLKGKFEELRLQGPPPGGRGDRPHRRNNPPRGGARPSHQH